MKLGFQDRLQVPFDHHLGDPVGNRRHAKRPGSSSVSLRDVNATHRWWEVASGAHPIPDPIEVPFQVPLEILDSLSVNARRPLVRLHLLVRLPHLALGDTKWLRLIHAGHPLSGCPLNKTG